MDDLEVVPVAGYTPLRLRREGDGDAGAVTTAGVGHEEGAVGAEKTESDTLLIGGSLPGFKGQCQGQEKWSIAIHFKSTLETSNSELKRFKGSLDKRSYSTRVDLCPTMD